jgi:Zn-dependent protease
VAVAFAPILADITGSSARDVVFLIIGLLVALPVHEYAHAFVAARLGDVTPRMQGRLTLNIKPHVDTFGTLLLPGILLLVVLFTGNPFVFAYAKPQPLNPWALRRQDRHVVLISMAGPAANLVLAFVFGLVFRAVATTSVTLAQLVGDVLIVNVILCVFNLFPIPPLDMTRVLARVVSPRARDVINNLEQYGALFMVLIFFIISGPIISFALAIGNGICQITAGAHCF